MYIVVPYKQAGNSLSFEKNYYMQFSNYKHAEKEAKLLTQKHKKSYTILEVKVVFDNTSIVEKI